MKKYPGHKRLSAAILSASVLGFSAQGQFYDYEYQNPVGDPAIFNVEGPGTASGSDHDPNGDVFLTSVEFPGGEKYTEYYRPVGVYGFQTGEESGRLISVYGANNISDGVRGKHFLGRQVSDGDDTKPTAADRAAFAESMRQALESNNLNWYVDSSSRNTGFEFIIEFDLELADNDPEPDAFGELLYFERGSGGGNSWLTLQAVDEHGNPLGPELAISPAQTQHTSPPAQITNNRSQYIGVASIDISRLGVAKTQYLRVRSTRTTDSGYYGRAVPGVDFNPDFKFMAVITHPAQIALRTATYD